MAHVSSVWPCKACDRMQSAQLYYDLPTIFAGLITIGVLGLLMDRILLFAEHKLTGWQERR